MRQVEIVSVEDAGFYSDERTYGSLVKVTLQRGNVFVSCDGILIWEEEDNLDEVFDEWLEYANVGEQGYTVWKE